MLKALNEQGKLVTLTKENKMDFKEQNFFCPVCHERLIVKAGTSRRWHFAHSRHSKCGASEAESEYHLKGKELLYEWLIEQNMHVDLEPYFSAIKQRADLFIKSSVDAPIEFQCSTISEQIFLSRTSNYMKLNQKPLWILGGNRFRRMGSHMFRVQRMDWLALNVSSKSPHEPFLLYFCPNADKFAAISNIIPFSSTKIVGNLQIFPRRRATLASLFKNKVHLPLPEKVLLQTKENWRTFPFRQHSPASRYVSRMLHSIHSDISLFPNEAGLLSRYLFWIETPPYLWQSWLLIHCIMPLSEREAFQFHDVYEPFKRLVAKGVFKVRNLPLVEASHYSFALMDYLLLLCEIGILSRAGRSRFLILKQIQLPKTLDRALQIDKRIQQFINQKR
mgnify:FL=1